MNHSAQGPSIHCRDVIMSCQGRFHQRERLHETGEPQAQPESGTSIVVILQKTLKPHTLQWIPRSYSSKWGFVRPRHQPSQHRTKIRAPSTLFKPKGTRAYSTVKLRRIPSDLLGHPDWYPKSDHNIALWT